MSGETDLTRLLKDMQPVIRDEVFVFVTLNDLPDIKRLEPLMMFREAEGVTLILERQMAVYEQLDGVFPSRMITLNIQSSLEAVGFIAAIASHLASHGISVNPVSGFYHDHIFISEDRADEAMSLLMALASE